MRDLLQYLLGLTSAPRVGAASVRKNLAASMLVMLTPVTCFAQTQAGLTFDGIARHVTPSTRAVSLSPAAETGAVPAPIAALSRAHLKIEAKWPAQTPGQRFQSQTSATSATSTSGPWWHGVLWGVAGGVGGFFAGGYIGDAISRHSDMDSAVLGALTGSVVGAIVLATIGP